MLVVDASAALSALLHDDRSRRALDGEQLHAPHLIDSEVANALRRRVAAGALQAAAGRAALEVLGRLGMRRHAAFPLLGRIWELRENLSAHDATYVALAEALDSALLTADARLAAAPGVRCAITLVPR